MGLRATDSEWGGVNKLMHWTLFILVIATFVAVNVAQGYERGTDERAWWMVMHRSFGITAMVLMLVWLVSRPWLGRPDQYGAKWQAMLSQVSHWGMILLVLGMPFAGILMAQFYASEVHVFNLFSIPVVLPENRDLGEMIYNMHTNVAAPLLAALILLHIVGAFWHHLIDKDNTLKRMLPWNK